MSNELIDCDCNKNNVAVLFVIDDWSESWVYINRYSILRI